MKLSLFKVRLSNITFKRIFSLYTLILVISLLYLYHYMAFTKLRFMSNPDARIVLLGDPQMEGTHRIITQGLYGKISVAINDYYFRHILNNIMWYVQPTHIFVLGDIFSYQNLPEEEFQLRLDRYNWIFSHPKIIEQHVKLVNISGNHDIGYANEVSPRHLERFSRAFGPVNTRYYDSGHIFAIVNSMNLDSARDQNLARETWEHIGNLSQERISSGMPLILFTHIPLFKPSGNCADDPEIWYDRNGYVREQWMLSENVTVALLNELKPVFVFTGHDHVGCEYKHSEETMEYTVRSMMGDFGGYTAILDIKKAGNEFVYKYYRTSFVIMYGITAMLVCIGNTGKSAGISYIVGIWIVLFVLWMIVKLVKRFVFRKRIKVD